MFVRSPWDSPRKMKLGVCGHGQHVLAIARCYNLIYRFWMLQWMSHGGLFNDNPRLKHAVLKSSKGRSGWVDGLAIAAPRILGSYSSHVARNATPIMMAVCRWWFGQAFYPRRPPTLTLLLSMLLIPSPPNSISLFPPTLYDHGLERSSGWGAPGESRSQWSQVESPLSGT